jgi:transcriptional regulator with XRE-family HTH domain
MEISIGKKLLRLRLDRKLTQLDVSEVTGLAVSYLSRLENGRITPRIPTLSKIANALGVEVTTFFSEDSAPQTDKRCPVSKSGSCLLDQLLPGKGRRPEAAGYTPRQVNLLRMGDRLIHSGDKKTLASLDEVLKALNAYTEPSGAG